MSIYTDGVKLNYFIVDRKNEIEQALRHGKLAPSETERLNKELEEIKKLLPGREHICNSLFDLVE